MRPLSQLAVIFTAAVICSAAEAHAQCTLPHTIANGQAADASKLMANFNALVSCISPGGATNAIQFNVGSGALAGVGPLTNGQLLIGSAGTSPQAQTLTAGSGIVVTNNPGSVAIAAGASTTASGLYRQVMSATPSSASTGLINWVNQGTAVLIDSAIGLSIDAPPSGNVARGVGLFKAAPTPPYTIRALIAATRNSNSFSGVNLGWYDGTSKLHVLGYDTNGGGAAVFRLWRWNSPTSPFAANFNSALNGFSQPIWLQLQDDGTNVSFGFSQDGANFLNLFSIAKSSGFLGANGYRNLIFMLNPQGASHTIGTLLSWTES